MIKNFDKSYRRLFEAVLADTTALMQEAYRLRYQVYCVEHDFLDPRDNPDGLERDAYDDHSVQAVLRHHSTGSTVGSVRLILHIPGARVGCLPIHQACQDPRIFDRGLLPLETTCELSRFAISKAFRQSINLEGFVTARGVHDYDFARLMPHITLGLMTISLQMGIANGITSVCAIMNPALLRLVSWFGFHFEPLGPPISYHGLRQPCYAEVDALLDGVKAKHPEIWQFITHPVPANGARERAAVA